MNPDATLTLPAGAPAAGLESKVAWAMATAKAAQPSWAAHPLAGRLRVVRNFRHLLARNASDLVNRVPRPAAETLTAQLIPLADACRFLERHAPSALRPRRPGLRDRPLWLSGVDVEIHREPAGTVLVLAPANYSYFIPGTQVVQALAAGNAVILKPAPGGEPAAVALRQLLLDSGLDPRLLSVLPPQPEAGALAVAQGPDHIVFTGSADTGRAVLRAAAGATIPCTLELSGCDAAIVRADAPLDLVVEALLFSLRLHDGATCIAPRRVLADRNILGELERRLSTALSSMPAVRLDERLRERLIPLLLAAKARGAIFLGPRSHDPAPTHGPVVVSRGDPALRLFREDLFGPVLAIAATRDDEDALRSAAQCPWKLGASIFTRDIARARTLAARLPAGTVTVNDLIVPTADPRIPFGGRGASGYGVTRGLEGLLELTRTKVVSVRRGRWLPHLDLPRDGDAPFFSTLFLALHGATLRSRVQAAFHTARLAVRRRRKPIAP